MLRPPLPSRAFCSPVGEAQESFGAVADNECKRHQGREAFGGVPDAERVMSVALEDFQRVVGANKECSDSWIIQGAAIVSVWSLGLILWMPTSVLLFFWIERPIPTQ